VVIEGQIELVLDSGEWRIVNRGDVAIQRATAHEWRNTSKTQSARLLLCLQEAEPILISGQPLEEEYGHSMPGVRPS
jgi:quercetin dioxygenase-like cupin family protein